LAQKNKDNVIEMTRRILRPGVLASLRTYCWALAALTLIAWAAAWFNGSVLHLPYPWDSPLFDPQARFSDLTDYYYKIHHLSQGGPGLARGLPIFVYPAPALFVYSFFILLFPYPVLAFLVFSEVVFIVGFATLRRTIGSGGQVSRLVNATLALTFVCSYPMLFLLDRANIEIVVFVFAYAGLVCFVNEAFLASSVFFAAAACIKPFPLLFFYLFLKKKRYKEIALAVVIVGIVNLIAMEWLGPTLPLAYASLQEGATAFLNTYVLSYRKDEIQFDHSLFSCVKQAIQLYLGWPPAEAMRRATLAAYFVYMPAASFLVIWCGWYFWRKPVLNQLFAVVLLMLVVPPVSYDYTLIAVYLLWGTFLICLTRDDCVERPYLFLISFALLMTPQSYLHTDRFGFGGQFKAVVILFLLIVAAKNDLPSSLFGDLALPGENALNTLGPSDPRSPL
jgi:Glycosyltransferase family 87